MPDIITALIPMAIFVLIFYVLIIRPQKKQEREVTNMRASVSVGDEIITIGGLIGRVVRVKEEDLTIEVGSDKLKFDVKKWALREVTKSTTVTKEIK